MKHPVGAGAPKISCFGSFWTRQGNEFDIGNGHIMIIAMVYWCCSFLLFFPLPTSLIVAGLFTLYIYHQQYRLLNILHCPYFHSASLTLFLFYHVSCIYGSLGLEVEACAKFVSRGV